MRRVLTVVLGTFLLSGATLFTIAGPLSAQKELTRSEADQLRAENEELRKQVQNLGRELQETRLGLERAKNMYAVARNVMELMIEEAAREAEREGRLKAAEEAIKWLEGTIESEREKAKRAACAKNLKQLITAIRTWSPDYDGKYPESLSELYPNYTTLYVFSCPSASGPKVASKGDIDSKTTYIYRTGLTEASPSDTVVIYENPSNHGGEGGHIAFADGHVKWFSAEELKKIVDKDGEREGVF